MFYVIKLIIYVSNLFVYKINWQPVYQKNNYEQGYRIKKNRKV